ncbi:hypothetical protein U1Q18_025283, partial [Sarracenia purpurea var. burkii]
MTDVPTPIAKRPAPTHASRPPDLLISPKTSPNYVLTLPSVADISADLSMYITLADDVQ